MRIQLFSVILALTWYSISAQVVINEVSKRNFTQAYDENGETHDWIELYNTSNTSVNLLNWSLTDNTKYPQKWVFPDVSMKPKSQLLIFASGLNIKKVAKEKLWESAVLPSDTFNYIEPNTSIAGWNTLEFDTTGWKKGIAGFGFNNGDDNTVTNTTSPVVYIRRNFSINDTSAIISAILHVDYDDGFVAYLNGVEIARANISGEPLWNSFAISDHAALMFSGGLPEKFELNMNLLKTIWKQGENVLSLEIHNNRIGSSDLSLIPFLSFGLSTSISQFKPVPAWFNALTGISFHTNFKISKTNENVYLTKPSGVITDSLVLGYSPLNSSYGRITDGATSTGIFLVSTPGKSNNTSKYYTNGYEPSPQLNIVSGFYATAQNITITDSSATAQIRYTLDGSEPTEASSLYSTPISITSTKILKTKSFSTVNKMPGKTVAATYFINQTHTIPVISVSTDDKHIWGATGIFDNTNADWKKPCYMEYFDANQKRIIAKECGVLVDGGAGGSRTQPQHSMRLEPGSGTFGSGNIDYELIPDRPNRKKYASLYLRNGSNQYATLQYKDGLETKAIAKNTYTYYSAHTPVVVYLNGAYFGVYELREKLDPDFFAENYLMDVDSIDLLTMSYYKGLVLEAMEGSVAPFLKDFETFKTLKPTTSSYLTQVSKFLDLDNYTDYIIAESWIGNNDWPNNNIRIMRCKSTNYKWRFSVLDVEWALDPNSWTKATFDHIGYMQSCDANLPYIGFWLGLMKNNAYKVSFINRFADLMNTNYLFSNIGAMEEEKYLLQYPEVQKNYARWKNVSLAAYKTNHLTLRTQLQIRSDNVRKHLQKHYFLSKQVEVVLDVKPAGSGQIKISTITPVSYPWRGIYFSGNPVKITAIPNPGYKFTNWDNNLLISDLNNPEATLYLSDTIQYFTANFEQNTDNFKGVTISEIHYKNGDNETSTDWFEIWNAGDNAVKLQDWHISDSDTTNIYQFNYGDYIGANSRLVMTRDTIVFKKRYSYAINYKGPLGFKLNSPVDAIKLFNESNELVTQVNFSDLYPWPLNSDVSGRTLELRNPLENLNDPSNWFAGCVGGSPGKAFKACPGTEVKDPMVINAPLISAYPIPANNFVTIAINMAKMARNCQINLYDSYGTLLINQKFGTLYAGEFTQLLNISKVPEGLVIIKFISDSKEQSIKIMRIK